MNMCTLNWVRPCVRAHVLCVVRLNHNNHNSIIPITISFCIQFTYRITINNLCKSVIPWSKLP